MDQKLFIAFAKFEENQKEHDRARVIYKYALDNMDKEQCADLYKAYTIHEKKFGERAGIENVIISKGKFQYEEELKENPMNFDAWFDFVRLTESEGNMETIRETYDALWPMCLRRRRSTTGGDTSISGSTMPSMRSWR